VSIGALGIYVKDRFCFRTGACKCIVQKTSSFIDKNSGRNAIKYLHNQEK